PAHRDLHSFPTRRSSDLPQELAYRFRVNNASGQTVSYTFLGKAYDIKPRYSSRHTSCAPGEIAFRKPGSEKVVARYKARDGDTGSEEHTSELQSREKLVC